MAIKMSTVCCHLVIVYLLVVEGTPNVHKFEMSDDSKIEDSLSRFRRSSERNRRSIDAKCTEQENNFLQDILSKSVPWEEKKVFDTDSSSSMALAWAGEQGGIMVVTSKLSPSGLTESSNVYKSIDYGKTFKKVEKLDNAKVRKHNGLQRNPHNAKKLYLVGDHLSNSSLLYITEDGGENFKTVTLPFLLSGEITFHSQKAYDNYLIVKEVIYGTNNLYISTDNGYHWSKVADYVESFKWGGYVSEPGETIYASVDPKRTHPFFAAFYQVVYELRKSTDAGKTWKPIMKNVMSFGHQGKFLYASVLQKVGQSNTRLMKVSPDGGTTWFEAQLPTLDSDMFYSVMDMEEDLVFMHVDDPGDTGHGTLYTSGGKGVIYSRSLEKHLYPNYGDTTDFYRMDSMRGVYIASQMSADDSIHSMITYNQGGSWQPIPRPEGGSCKDEKKDCNLQIHGTYSITRGILAQSPISVSSAIGVAMVHGHIADALQTTHPDVYITRDGGYKWIKALDGPHHYHIADSGSLLVAVPSDTDKPKVIKFSTDEGRCWHSYTFIKNDTEAIKFTGLLTEPGSTSMTVSIWGYHPDNRKWTAYVFDFQSILKQQCTSNDYEEWLAHETVRKYESESMKGCLLGEKEMFKRLKPDSWCHNGYDYVVEKDVQPCTCSREDFECDYGYYRPVGGLDCLRNRSMTILDICMQGREEEIITEGFRKIPGDVCKNGFSPSGKVINLSKHCKEGDKSLIDIGTPVEKKGTNGTVVAAIVLMVILIVVLMSIYFGYKLWMIRKHRVVYRYSLLNQSEAGDYDNEFENALSPKSVVYQDSSDDEELNSPAVKKDVTKKKSHSGSSNSKTGNGHVFKSYHDDSDVDMID
ncbi:sortilin-like isoform X2 [Mizuhopecten yessoensis]|uniref:sortilin-like isoform X2 n=1 Tax=Mizuhopecten yessoensis TaxID=6573 RepID=UPI000B459465|nr:sortilin-like isoform X2 [Mizuhopecten yessoensis]